jgi:hypothetical protein
MMALVDAADWVSSGTTTAVAIAGLIVANSVRAQTKMKIYERRLDAYAQLWKALKPLGLTAPVLDETGRASTAKALTQWYYSGGLLLTAPTQKMFTRLRDHVANPPPSPDGCHERLQREASLLRTQLKADLEIYFGGHVSSDLVKDQTRIKYLRDTVLHRDFYTTKPRRTRLWMRVRFRLESDDPIMRARALWLSVIRPPS